MKFVKSLDMFHVDAKEIPCLTLAGAPTEQTEGAVGVLYMNTDDGSLYKCTGAADGVYTWEAVGGAGVELDTTLSVEGKAADAKAVGDALDKKLGTDGGALTGKIVFPTGNANAGFANTEDIKIFGYGTVDGVSLLRMGDPGRPFQIRGSTERPQYNDDELVLFSELQGALGSYITDIATLVGGDA